MFVHEGTEVASMKMAETMKADVAELVGRLAMEWGPNTRAAWSQWSWCVEEEIGLVLQMESSDLTLWNDVPLWAGGRASIERQNRNPMMVDVASGKPMPDCAPVESMEEVCDLSISAATRKIEDFLAYPFAWEKVGLGDVTVLQAKAYAQDRAAQIVSWLLALGAIEDRRSR
jgi:hypothetical protein